jgi:uncharacterized protein YndB with AHSA1/START domain
MNTLTTDRIEKQVFLRAPRTRVWHALADAREFGRWFNVELANPFAPGAHVEGKMTYPGYEGMSFEIWIERMEPEQLFSFRWHPYAIEPEVDFSAEPTTLVVFELADVEDGTQLTVVESGFDQIPLERRARAFASNDEGWAHQMKAIEEYVDAKR